MKVMQRSRISQNPLKCAKYKLLKSCHRPQVCVTNCVC